MSGKEKRDSGGEAAELVERLGEVVKGKKELLIVTHTHPDPDAIASAVALKLLVAEKFGVSSSISYSGIIARAENRAMVKKLAIPLKQYNRIKLARYDCIALVDSQPGAGNNVLRADSRCDIVIDHHPPRKDTKAPLTVIDPEAGATATILIGWLDAAKVAIPADVATGLAYALSSETQNMHREAGRDDIKAYLSVYVRASIRKLAEIINARLPHYYFNQLGNAINNALTYGTIIVTHLEVVHHPEIVAEMADFFLKHERIGTVIASGLYKDHLIISVRTRSDLHNAGMLIKKLPLDPDNVGGHDRTGGGYLDVSGMNAEKIGETVKKLQETFAAVCGYEKPQWRKLLG
jgi:nanoRNase/pAp phosphatase (c-di-AMP/oligoRNAs hydrolase)